VCGDIVKISQKREGNTILCRGVGVFLQNSSKSSTGRSRARNVFLVEQSRFCELCCLPSNKAAPDRQEKGGPRNREGRLANGDTKRDPRGGASRRRFSEGRLVKAQHKGIPSGTSPKRTRFKTPCDAARRYCFLTKTKGERTRAIKHVTGGGKV